MPPDNCASNKAIRSAPTFAVHTPNHSIPLRAMSDFSHRERVFLRHDPLGQSQRSQTGNKVSLSLAPERRAQEPSRQHRPGVQLAFLPQRLHRPNDQRKVPSAWTHSIYGRRHTTGNAQGSAIPRATNHPQHPAFCDEPARSQIAENSRSDLFLQRSGDRWSYNDGQFLQP